MTDQSTCPHCGQPVNIYMQSCPLCHADLAGAQPVTGIRSPLVPTSPEGLIPRLGDILIERKLISRQQLEAALARQRESIAQAGSIGRQILLGQILVENGWITREVLDQVVTEQIMGLHSALQENNRKLEQRVQQRTGDLQGRLLQIRTAAEITQVAISASNLEEMLSRTVKLIAERLNYYCASIYLINEMSGALELAASSMPGSMERKVRQTHDVQFPKTMVAWAVANRKARVAADVSREPLYWVDPLLQDTRSEATLPVALGDQVLGVLDVHSNWVNAFDDEAVTVLQTIANHIAAVIQNFRLLDHTRKSLEQSQRLNETNHRLNLAQNAQSVFSEVVDYLKASSVPSLLLVAEGNQFRVIAGHLPNKQKNSEARLPGMIAVPPEKLLAQMPPGQLTFSLPRSKNTTQLQNKANSWISALMRVHDWLECDTITLIPVRQQNALMAMMVLARPASQFAESVIKGSNIWQPYISLAEQATTTLEKLSAFENLQRQISAMQSLDAITKVIALETEPGSLYRAIHQQLRELLGELDFLLAEYREANQTITIPYAYENGEEINLPSMPLGQGLTSVIIKSKQPLLLSGNVEQQAQRLGARVIGLPAKSWMGVPLIVANQVIGAMILQDTRRENRFGETELRLVNTLATQVAIAVRNARLYQETSRLAEQERLASDLTARVWSSPDIETILRVALEDLGSKLQAAEAMIELDVQAEALDGRPAASG